MNAFDVDQYIRQGEPSHKEKAQIWQTAIGLQDVDGLKPSQYLLENALLATNHDLKNRTMHIRFAEQDLQINKNTDSPVNEAVESQNTQARFGVKFGVKFGVNQERMLALIAKDSHVTAAVIAARLKISKRAVESNLAKLKALGILSRIGADKNGHWQINNPVRAK